MHNFVINLIIIYILTMLLKLVYYSIRISYGKKLINKITVLYNNRKELNRLFPQLKNYCERVKLPILTYPYNETVNLLNPKVQENILDLLNKAIGINMVNRRKCYILLPINENNKTISLGKTFLDAFIKIAASVLTVIIEHMC